MRILSLRDAPRRRSENLKGMFVARDMLKNTHPWIKSMNGALTKQEGALGHVKTEVEHTREVDEYSAWSGDLPFMNSRLQPLRT